MTLDTPTLAALRARPDDLDAFRVLADRLQSEGDPRGELISLQLHGQPKLVERHLALHARELLGRLFTQQSQLELDWVAGFIRRARVSSSEGVQRYNWLGRVTFEHQARRPFPWMVQLLLQLESSALLEELTLALAPSPKAKLLFGEAVEQVARLAPPTLQRLALVSVTEHTRRRDPFEYEEPFEPLQDPWLPQRQEVLLHGRKLVLEANEVSLLDHAHAVLRDGG